MKKHILTLSLCTLLFTSCVTQIKVTDVTYQSVRNKNEALNTPREIPDSAKIYIDYNISQHGILTVNIKNLTDEIMIIDQTKSFVVNSDGTSTPYYDPTVKTKTVTDLSSNQVGGSVNLGAVGGAIGIDGTVGQILNGINVGSSTTSGQSVANTTYSVELPQLNIAPKGRISLKNFGISNLGYIFTETVATENKSRKNIINTGYTPANSYCTFSVCISYSIDEGKTFQKLISEFYANSVIVIPVKSKREVNEALREVLKAKRDYMNEPFWIQNFKVNDNSAQSLRYNSKLYNFQ